MEVVAQSRLVFGAAGARRSSVQTQVQNCSRYITPSFSLEKEEYSRRAFRDRSSGLEHGRAAFNSKIRAASTTASVGILKLVGHLSSLIVSGETCSFLESNATMPRPKIDLPSLSTMTRSILARHTHLCGTLTPSVRTLLAVTVPRPGRRAPFALSPYPKAQVKSDSLVLAGVDEAPPSLCILIDPLEPVNPEPYNECPSPVLAMTRFGHVLKIVVDKDGLVSLTLRLPLAVADFLRIVLKVKR